MKLPVSLLLLGSAGLLSACASPPKAALRATGTMPQAGGIELVGAASDDGAWGTALLEKLAARGLSRSQEAAYFVQFTNALLPGRTGLFAPEGGTEEKTWLVSPTRFRSIDQQVYTLVVSDRATGRELYRLVGQMPVPRGKPGSESRLSQAFLAELGSTTEPGTAGR
ncbi:MAG: hypothetical protein J7530_18555 [Novosphingobium sp.]|nr:hypothetical protein [Novosphingobium sp.]